MALSFSPVFASYNISVEADGIALQGARDSIYEVKIKNLGSQKIDSAEVFITEIAGRPVTSDGDYKVANNPQTVTFLGEKGDRLIFPISIKKDAEPGIKDVKIKVIIGDESIEKQEHCRLKKIHPQQLSQMTTQ
ncbi:MAG: hypothetical protein R2883_02545 [Caldisericia bacterium]